MICPVSIDARVRLKSIGIIKSPELALIPKTHWANNGT